MELAAVTSEGDRTFLSFYDTEKQEECLPARDAEGTFRCLPSARDKDLVNVYYLDAACTQEAHYRGNCALDYQAIPVSSDPCDGRRRLVPFGERVPDQLVYRRSATGACEPYGELNRTLWIGSRDACMPYTPEDQYTYYVAGDVVANDEFMSATREF